MVDKDTTVCFRYKKEDRIVYCNVYSKELWDDGIVDDSRVCVDMDDDFLEGLINTLKLMPTYEDPKDNIFAIYKYEGEEL